MADYRDLIKSTVASPISDLIASVGEGVAKAQASLDEGSLAATLDIYAEGDDEKLALMRDIGYRPTFYALPETIGEIQVALKMGISEPKSSTKRSLQRLATNRTGRAPVTKKSATLYATPVDAAYSNTFGYSTELGAKVTFKIVPVPAPEGVEDLRVVPALVGKTIADALEITERLDLEILVPTTNPPVAETKTITAQDPGPDEIVRSGAGISVQV